MQILHRRQQQGVRYPQTGDDTRSKLVTLENVSIYCDTNAEKFVKGGTCNTDAGRMQALRAFREKARQAYAPNPLRDMFFASVIWIKLDLSKKETTSGQVDEISAGSGGDGGVTVSAVDFVTEALKLNFDFIQLSAMNEELTLLSDFRRMTQVRQWRPSCIDREQVTPPKVRVANTVLLPIVAADNASALSFPPEKQRRTQKWLREMWRFAAWRVLVGKRKGNPNLLRFTLHKSDALVLDEDTRAHRYADLYARNLSSDALQMIVYGKKLIWTSTSPRRSVENLQLQHDEQSPSSPPLFLPILEPLTREEQWELSDMILDLSVPEQRKYRSMAEATLRACKNSQGSAPPSPPRFTADASSPLTVTSPAPADNQNSTLRPVSPSSTSTRLPEHPADTTSDHHHITRSLTESALQPKQHQHTTPKLAQLHFASTNSLPLPLKPHAGERLSPTRTTFPVASGNLKQLWVQQAFIPAWVLKKRLPLLNWSIGPISLWIFRDNSARSSSPAKSAGYGQSHTTTADRLGEEASIESDTARCEFLKIGFERCSGAILLSSPPTPSFLVELRLGLFHATLFSPSHHKSMSSPSRNNSISSDYIKDPDDGSFYVGLKYSCKDGATSVTESTGREFDIKGKVCIGPITIDYNELTLQTTLATTVGIPLSRKCPSAASFEVDLRVGVRSLTCTCVMCVWAESLDIASSTYISIILDVYRSWRELYQRFRTQKQQPVVRHEDHFYSELLNPVGFAAMKIIERQQQQAAKRARLEKLLNAILLYASAIEVELGRLKMTVSLLTSHVEQMLGTTDPQALLFGYEDFIVELPHAQFGLHNVPALNECRVSAAGAQVQFRTTKQGRAAATEYLLRRLVGKP